MKMMLMMNSDF